MYLQRLDPSSLSADLHSVRATNATLTSESAAARPLKGVTERHVPHQIDTGHER